jgi:hypothetical protein
MAEDNNAGMDWQVIQDELEEYESWLKSDLEGEEDAED